MMVPLPVKLDGRDWHHARLLCAGEAPLYQGTRWLDVKHRTCKTKQVILQRCGVHAIQKL